MNLHTDSPTLTVDSAARLARLAVNAGIAREADAPAFMGWLLDAYRDEDVSYLESVGLATLWARFPQGGSL